MQLKHEKKDFLLSPLKNLSKPFLLCVGTKNAAPNSSQSILTVGQRPMTDEEEEEEEETKEASFITHVYLAALLLSPPPPNVTGRSENSRQRLRDQIWERNMWLWTYQLVS